MEFDWYELCPEDNNSLEQGDLILECPIVIPPGPIEEGDSIEIDVKEINSIVLTQSCDLANDKIEIVLVCQYYPLLYWLDSLPAEQQGKKARKKAIDDLRKGHYAGFHVINKIGPESLLEDYQVVDFRNVYGVNIDLLKKIVLNKGERVRLLPPYREHLSQAFARYFMRVGLPQDLRIDDDDF
jgi:hypothetical protein